jgi:hypothetical protein
MTYQVNRQTYATAPYFLWQTPRAEPAYHHEVLRSFYRWELGHFEESRTFLGFVKSSAVKLEEWWQFYLGPALTLPLLALPWAVRERKMRWPIIVAACLAIGLSVQTWTLPHYFAPATGLLLLIVTQCIRHLRLWRWQHDRMGQSLVRLLPAVLCALIVLRVAAVIGKAPIEPRWPRGNLERPRVQSELQNASGTHLVFVSYGPNHDPDWEWVWNSCDIDQSKVIWARDMGEAANRELLAYFRGRQSWRIDADDPHPMLRPY